MAIKEREGGREREKRPEKVDAIQVLGCVCVCVCVRGSNTIYMISLTEHGRHSYHLIHAHKHTHTTHTHTHTHANTHTHTLTHTHTHTCAFHCTAVGCNPVCVYLHVFVCACVLLCVRVRV